MKRRIPYLILLSIFFSSCEKTNIRPSTPAAASKKVIAVDCYHRPLAGVTVGILAGANNDITFSHSLLPLSEQVTNDKGEATINFIRRFNSDGGQIPVALGIKEDEKLYRAVEFAIDDQLNDSEKIVIDTLKAIKVRLKSNTAVTGFVILSENRFYKNFRYNFSSKKLDTTLVYYRYAYSGNKMSLDVQGGFTKKRYDLSTVKGVPVKDSTFTVEF